MDDRKNVIKGLEQFKADFKPFCGNGSDWARVDAAIALLKKQDSLLGIQQTADRITFISTGTARQGEERGLLLGKAFMHEWIYKELLHKDLLTDEIRFVFERAKHI